MVASSLLSLLLGARVRPSAPFSFVRPGTPSRGARGRALPASPPPSRRDDGGLGDDDDDGAADDDWREFRAQLVRSEGSSDDGGGRSGSDDPRHYAYETGDLVERGSIVISVPSVDPYLDDVDSLTNVCYRKSVVLVLDAAPDFVRGVMLNRPTDVGVKEGPDDGTMRFVRPGRGEEYEDELGSCLGEGCEASEDGGPASAAATPRGARWKVWFGGEAGGPYSDDPHVVCLHSVETELAASLSDRILPGVHLTTFEGARAVVRAGQARPSDFWLFCGVCGWETSSFLREMREEGLWHVASVDGGTVWAELDMLRCEEEDEEAAERGCDVDRDPRNAGLHVWDTLAEDVGIVGKSDGREGQGEEEPFGDLMLREWATDALFYSAEVGAVAPVSVEDGNDNYVDDDIIDNDDKEFVLSEYDPASAMGGSSSMRRDVPSSLVGAMFRASSALRSPFLLSDQGFHKSLVLILRDDDDVTEGAVLNRPTSDIVRLDLGDGKTGEWPVRWGGPAQGPSLAYEEGRSDRGRGDVDDDDESEQGEASVVFLHASDALQRAGVGLPLGTGPVCRCSEVDVVRALASGAADGVDFVAVRGVATWAKGDSGEGGRAGGVLGDVASGYFEPVSSGGMGLAWEALLLQTRLTSSNIVVNASEGRRAWSAAGLEVDEDVEKVHVFGTSSSVAMLADEAADRWMKVNFL
ncbi:hypothetical protein ACHAWF_004032 [Thalassiosira exigua]